MPLRRSLVQVALPSWLSDHRFGGRIILPAVTAMELLAVQVQETWPTVAINAMTGARFLRFLEIPPGTPRIDILVELELQDNGAVLARLQTRSQRATLARTIQHCELLFGAEPPPPVRVTAPDPACPDQVGVDLAATDIYRQLIPFGPSFQTLVERLTLKGKSARGKVLAAGQTPTITSPALLGSPFPLDGAMHAACVHGQLQVDFVPFPVGFASRTISRPTEAGEHYHVEVYQQSRAMDELLYDLVILDQDKQVREQVQGLRMRDVSGGRIKPPPWTRTMRLDRQTP